MKVIFNFLNGIYIIYFIAYSSLRFPKHYNKVFFIKNFLDILNFVMTFLM